MPGDVAALAAVVPALALVALPWPAAEAHATSAAAARSLKNMTKRTAHQHQRWEEANHNDEHAAATTVHAMHHHPSEERWSARTIEAGGAGHRRQRANRPCIRGGCLCVTVT